MVSTVLLWVCKPQETDPVDMFSLLYESQGCQILLITGYCEPDETEVEVSGEFMCSE